MYTATFYNIADVEKKAPLEKGYTKTIPMNTAAIVKDQRIYAPVAYLAETLGYRVEWMDYVGNDMVEMYSGDREETIVALSMRDTADVLPTPVESGGM